MSTHIRQPHPHAAAGAAASPQAGRRRRPSHARKTLQPGHECTVEVTGQLRSPSVTQTDRAPEPATTSGGPTMPPGGPEMARGHRDPAAGHLAPLLPSTAQARARTPEWQAEAG